VIDAYRETIVQLDHYEEEYGNPIHQDIVLEFGEQVAHAVFAPGPLSSMAFRLLVAQAKESLEERTQHARELDREHDSLERFDADLSEIETRFAECPVPSEVAAESVPTIRDELLELERNCERLIDRRQDMLHSRSTTNLHGVGELSFNTYVYGQRLSVSCPVLHDAVTLFRDIRAQRRCCEETLPQSAIQEPR